MEAKQLEKYEESIYDEIATVAGYSNLSLNNNTIEIEPDSKSIDAAVEKIVSLMYDFADDNFIETCKGRGMRNLCDHCDERFTCWTER